MGKPKVTYFKSSAEFRRWLEWNHQKIQELWVGFYKKDSGKIGITYPEAVAQALCFGWIDGLKKRVDIGSYTHRFTPRKPKSNWSFANINHVGALAELDLMMPAGLKAFAAREKIRTYSHEAQHRAELGGVYKKTFRATKKAWHFFQAQAPWYQRTASWWVVSAKKEETRQRRLATLIEDSAKGRRLGMLTNKLK